MTIQDIHKRITEIKEQAHQGDNEVAHSREDSLREDFIKMIAVTTPEDFREMATLILLTNDLEFARWCA